MTSDKEMTDKELDKFFDSLGLTEVNTNRLMDFFVGWSYDWAERYEKDISKKVKKAKQKTHQEVLEKAMKTKHISFAANEKEWYCKCSFCEFVRELKKETSK